MTPDTRGAPGARQRIVVRTPNWLGDAVMSLPALRDVRRHFAGATLAVATPRSLASFYRIVPDIDAIVELAGDRGMQHLRGSRDVEALSAGRFDIAILFTNSFNSAWVMRRAGIAERWGYRADFRSRLLTRAIVRPRGATAVPHHALYYQFLVRALGIETGDLDAALSVPARAVRKADDLLRERGWDGRARLIGIAPGAAYGGAKRWPPDRMAGLVGQLRSDLQAACVLVGSPGDVATARAIESTLEKDAGSHRPPAGLIDLVGKTDLETLLGVLRHCAGFVSNDSGAMHLAAAAGVPVVAIFGPTDERATSPLGEHEILTQPVWCRPCHLRECPIDHRCMKRITVPMVAEAVARHLRVVPDAPA